MFKTSLTSQFGDGVDAQGYNASPTRVLWFWTCVALPLSIHRQKSVRHSVVTSSYVIRQKGRGLV